MEHFVTSCYLIPGRRKPVYRVRVSCRVPHKVKPRRGLGAYLIIPTDRIIQRGAIINPTRELKRYLRAKQNAELMDIWRKSMLHFAGTPFDVRDSVLWGPRDQPYFGCVARPLEPELIREFQRADDIQTDKYAQIVGRALRSNVRYAVLGLPHPYYTEGLE